MPRKPEFIMPTDDEDAQINQALPWTRTTRN